MDFERAVEFILKAEGGYVWDEKDPGGETNFGISKRAYPSEDIKNMTRERAKFLYKRDYWDRCKCDDLPDGLRLAVFDAAVNQGVGAAVRVLQACCRVKQDGVIGVGTLSAARSVEMAEYLAARGVRYTQTANFDRFGKGWLTRLFHLALFS